MSLDDMIDRRQALETSFRHHPHKDSIIDALLTNNYTALELEQWFAESEWYNESHVRGLLTDGTF